MAFGKSAEDKQAKIDRKAAEQFAQTPIGRAHAARQRGDAFFQIEIENGEVGRWAASGFGSAGGQVRRTGGRPDLLGQIEDVGWRLEHVGYVFVETGATTSNRPFSTGQGVVTRGKIVGIYLFRAR